MFSFSKILLFKKRNQSQKNNNNNQKQQNPSKATSASSSSSPSSTKTSPPGLAKKQPLRISSRLEPKVVHPLGQDSHKTAFSDLYAKGGIPW